ncbi:MAG: hypothetical protein JO362_24915 [Streptomycetaceae bacterium]|nr:hypothetical protein [Streptomycetaceae bacterium]
MVGVLGAPLEDLRAMRLSADRVAVVPTNGRILTWIMLDPEIGRRVEDGGTHALGGILPMVFRSIEDAPAGEARPCAALDGEPDQPAQVVPEPLPEPDAPAPPRRPIRSG